MVKKKPRRKSSQPKARKVEFPDTLAKYYQIKYPETWNKFKEFATTVNRFSTGVRRLIEKLALGDEQDRRVFGYIPVSFLDDNGIKLDIEDSNGNTITLGEGKHKWSNVCIDINFKGTSITENLDPLPDPDNFDSQEDKETAIAMRDHIESHPVIKKAMEMFGGKLVGYSK